MTADAAVGASGDVARPAAGMAMASDRPPPQAGSIGNSGNSPKPRDNVRRVGLAGSSASGIRSGVVDMSAGVSNTMRHGKRIA